MQIGNMGTSICGAIAIHDKARKAAASYRAAFSIVMTTFIAAIALCFTSACAPREDAADTVVGKAVANDLGALFWIFKAPDDISQDETIAIAYRFSDGSEESICGSGEWEPGDEARVYFRRGDDGKYRVQLAREASTISQILQNPIFEKQVAVLQVDAGSVVPVGRVLVKFGEVGVNESFSISDELELGQVGIVLARSGDR